MGAQNKRKQPATASKSNSQKRRRTSRRDVAIPKRAVHVDKLPWRDVELPEMFDDAEGFFGLEEVEGVDVVRNGNVIEFVAAVPPAPSGDESEGFEGFDDLPKTVGEPEAATREAEHGEGNAKEKGEAQPKKDKTKKNKKKPAEKPVADPELESNLFTNLGDLDESNGYEDIDLSHWVALDLSSQMLSSLSRLKFQKPTAIQSAAIPEIIKGHDVVGKASTGSGKTLAFGIPIVEKWLDLHDGKDVKEKSTIALVLSPTRELAHQITNHLKSLCTGLPSSPYICSVTGGLSVHKQQRQLESADIVVATPGRLWEVMSSSTTLLKNFRQIKFLVVDEADRLLTEGNFKEAKEIFDALDRADLEEDEEAELSPRQTLVFSATFNKGLQRKLAGKGKYDLLSEAESMEYLLTNLKFREERPKFIDVNPVSQMAEGLREGLVECGAMEKDLYLYALLMFHSSHRTLVFTNSISSVRRLTPMLQNLNLPAYALHSQMPQKARLRSVERFTAAPPNTASILIATDVAARGLDIPGIDVVIHYHVPRAADAYVHRSGRTARAQRSGLSILLCAPEEVVSTRRLIAKVHANQAWKKKRQDTADSDGSAFFVETIDIDRRLVARLRQRVEVAKKIADASLAKEKHNKEDDWMRAAAEELGVDYDEEELEKAGSWGGRGSDRKKKQKEAQNLTKAEIGSLRADLKELLSRRVNAGVSEKYIARGDVDVDELLKGVQGDFLGKIAGLGVFEWTAS